MPTSGRDLMVGDTVTPALDRRRILKTNVTVCDYNSAADSVLHWAKLGSGTYTTCHVNSHGVVHALSDAEHQVAMNSADLVTPDGSSIVKALQRMGVEIHDRVYGPDLMEMICARAAVEGVAIGLYGGKQETLDDLEARLRERYPSLKITYKHSPPFRPLTSEEIAIEDNEMRASGTQIYFVGLGCPKQELYVHAKKVRGIPGVFMAVGAAIDINSGRQRKCPPWMQRHGLEWFFRLSQDPKRLWKRYGKYPFLFLLHLNRQFAARSKGNSI